jgi:hypothetical protein
MTHGRNLLLLGVLALLAGTCGGNEGPVCDPEACLEGYQCSIAGPCIPAGPGNCYDARDCEPGQTCGADGLCTFHPDEDCNTDQNCRSGEFCSAAGRCIAVGSCGDPEDCDDPDEDCSPGGLCLPAGTCDRNADCHRGTVCEDGECVPGGECGESEYGLDVPPNLLILLDRSGSMNNEIDGTPKWEIAVDAVTSTIGDWEGSIWFGLAIFSNCDGPLDRCNPGIVEVPCGADTVGSIVRTLGKAERCGSTPIAASLDGMVGEPSIQDPSRNNAILLVTDGMDSCGGDPSSASANLFAQETSVKTYVVGFGSEVDADELRATAEAGGTGAGDPAYYQADDAGGLAAALGAIAGRLLGCTYPLSEVPPDPAMLFVFFNDEERLDRDEADGWTYDEDTNTVIFHGSACDRIEAGEIRDIDIVYGCPEPVD